MDYPTTNTVLGTGRSYDIKWTANINDKIKIELFNGDSFYHTIAEELKNLGFYSWTIGLDVINGDDFKIVITSEDNEKIKQETGTFTIRENSVPKVSSGEITNTNYFTAQAKGDIENFGIESSAIEHGHCWSTSGNPTIEDSKTELGGKITTGVFTSELVNLQDSTTYYIRAYAINAEGSAYGEEKTFMTDDVIEPTLSTDIVTDLGFVTATCGGDITSSGTFEITAHGVCWSTSERPTIIDKKTNDGSGTGSFISSISGLSDNTAYYIRAYATNTVGTTYGNTKTFTTLDLLTDNIEDYDGNIYETIILGDQTWMAENLKATKYQNGDNIETTSPSTVDISSESAPKYQWAYNGDESNVTTYGRLYTQNAATDSRNICPVGWHLPSKAEFQLLQSYLITNGYNYDGTTIGNKIGKSLASLTHWESYTSMQGVPGNDFATNNRSGFMGIPSGSRKNQENAFGDMGVLTFWWSTNEDETFAIVKYWESASIFPISNDTGVSVRCIKD